MKAQKLTLVSHPQDFFRELVTSAIQKSKVTARPETEFYLVNLLNRFMTTDHLYPQNENGELREEPLVFMVKEALEESQPALQGMMFRNIGDVSLYVGGFFQERLAHKRVDVDYYISMGGNAYRNAAHRIADEALRPVYLELSEKFAKYLDVFLEVSHQTTPRKETDLVQMVELWLRTKSPRAAKALHEAGIVPTDLLKKDWQ
jgi:hypothetical protein